MADPAKPAGLQALLDASADGTVLTIRRPLEREGPIAVRRGVTLAGGGRAAVWSRQSPVVTIHAANAGLTDIRVEYTGDDPDGCALHLLNADVALANVTVRGNVLGVRGESGPWRYPHQLYLGKLVPDTDVEFVLRLMTPVPCRLKSEIDGLTVEPATLPAGRHGVRIHVEGLRRDTLIFGVIALETPGLRREVVVNGHAVPLGGPPVPVFPAGHVIWQPADWAELAPPSVKSLPVRPPTAGPALPAGPSPPAVPAPVAVPKPKLRPGGAILGSAFGIAPPPPPVSPDPAEQPPPAPPPPPDPSKKKAAVISPLFGGPPPPPPST